MISFRFKNQTKRVNIRTKQKLDERMSKWLQKVFSFRNQIIGFKTQDHKIYDVQSFYKSIDNFFGTTVDIIEAGDQLEISFTSQNLNSQSFVRPSQPNTSGINPKEPSQDEFEDFTIVSDRKSFEKMIHEGKDISVLFDINGVYQKTVIQNGKDLVNNKYSFNINLYMYINNSHPKKSCFSIYIGKSCVVTFCLIKDYIDKIKQFLNRYKKSTVLVEKENKVIMQAKGSHQQQDQAPSFTTYHLQQRLNQQACVEYLTKMYKEDRCLRNFEYQKLLQKCEQNFSEFYRLFCEGIMDNDYESFRNEILHRVENNLQLILSNVEEMDLSRPISRQQQRRNNLKKSVPQIQIVKVQNYFEILDQLKNQLAHDEITEIKQLLLDEDRQFHGYFAQYLSREITQEVLAFKLHSGLSKRKQKTRPVSRYLPGRPVKSKSVDPIRRKQSDEQLQHEMNKRENANKNQQSNSFKVDEDFLSNRKDDRNVNYQTQKGLTLNNRVDEIQNNNIIEEAPMFGSVRNEDNFSPIKFMSDMESNYKHAWNKLSEKSDEFQAQQYGLLYHLLQKRDDSISNFIQQLDWNETESISNIKHFLQQKIQSIFSENFTSTQIEAIPQLKHTHPIDYIFENFKYESDLGAFLSSLKFQLQKLSPLSIQSKTLHKKSSDSQLLENKQKNLNKFAIRKYSDENMIDIDPRSPSPKDSEYSLCNKNSSVPDLIDVVKSQWKGQFQQMIKAINFSEDAKQEFIRELYRSGNPRVFGWVRNYMKGQQQYFGSQQIQQLKQSQRDRKFLLSVLPIYDEFLRLYVEDGLITEKVRKWTVSQILSQNFTLISAFQLYLETKEESDFVETISMTYEHQNKQMEFYNTYLKRLEALLKQMSINDEVGMEVFAQFPSSIKALCELYFMTGNLEDMLDTLEVLYQKQIELRRIKVATLNFSAINTSPFEYFDGSQEIEKLDSIFKANLQRQRPGMKTWEIGKIDKLVQNRFSIGYLEGFEEIKKSNLLTRKQFEEKWRSKFPQLNQLNFECKNQQIEQCLLYDWLIYLSVLQFVYEEDFQCIDKSTNDPVQKTNQFQAIIGKLSSDKLIKYLEEKRNKPQCRVQIKQQLVIEYLLKQSLDVLFLQQAGCIDWNQDLVKEYSCVKNADSLIIFKKQKIGQVKFSLQSRYSKQLNFNKDSACFFSDKNYLLLSVHLCSNKKNVQQFKNALQTIQRVLHEHPMLKLIVGIDANHFIQEDVLPGSLKLRRYPEDEVVATTVKKRTHLQAQLPKAGVLVSEVKDFIITNRNMNSEEITNIKGEGIRSGDKKQVVDKIERKQDVQQCNDGPELIPNDRHPYDHFVVRGEVY